MRIEVVQGLDSTRCTQQTNLVVLGTITAWTTDITVRTRVYPTSISEIDARFIPQSAS